MWMRPKGSRTLTPTHTQLMGIPAGPAGIQRTLQIMAHLAGQGKTATPVRETTMALVATVPDKNYRAEITRVFTFVRDRVRYTKDVRGVETVQTPVKTLEYMQGDCDDQCTLLSAMLESIGFHTRFVAIGFAPNHYAHVYLQVLDGDQWTGLDPTEKVGVGWEPPNPVAVMVQPVP